MGELKYRPDIDGLRALAVGLVVLFHCGFGFTGGFVGVDVFFVISGFLITGIIRKQQAAERFSLADFWMRRIRRIAPASTVMVVVTLVLGTILLLPNDLKYLADSAICQQLMVSNFYFWTKTGYFDGPSDLMPLLHTWSLAVEEQFYLFFPLILFMTRRWPAKRVVKLLGGITFVSLAISSWSVKVYPSSAFFLLPARAWEMLLGGLLTYAPSPTALKRWHLSGISWLGLLAIFAAGVFYDSATPFPGIAALIPCIGACLVIYSNSLENTGVGRILSHRFLTTIGLMSYSLYLWHWPLIVFPKYWLGEDLSVAIRLAILAGSFLLAYLSWKFIETPFRSGKRTSFSWRPLQAGVAVCVCLSVFSVWIISTEGMRFRFTEEALKFCQTRKRAGLKYSRSLDAVLNESLPTVGVTDGPNDKIDCVLWGDSHAGAIVELCDRLATKHGLNCVVATHGGWKPLLGTWRPYKGIESREWNDRVLEFIDDHDVEHVILAARWADGSRDATEELESLMFDDLCDFETPDKYEDVVERGLKRTIARLEETGAKVWIVAQVPDQEGLDPEKKVFSSVLFDEPFPTGVSMKKHHQRQFEINQIFDEIDDDFVTILDPTPYAFDEDGRSLICDEDGLFYRDSHHITPLGAEKLVSKVLEPVFEEITKSTNSVRSTHPAVQTALQPSDSTTN
ncbi:O-acetyltransferase OatA [Thalassoglobus neptunius]|uniref:O-acetyltransferase OatA n=1 Tax=Thalassoglobus neptunius TaxID=1938619 RepID=A0A5C5WPT4_9PLAN|nr:acyltransferase family protein [Thalassoglobus neptunius]TWT52275.1 O-acetyltransferase OatA [Thalassoglobus neptunius]